MSFSVNMNDYRNLNNRHVDSIRNYEEYGNRVNALIKKRENMLQGESTLECARQGRYKRKRAAKQGFEGVKEPEEKKTA